MPNGIYLYQLKNTRNNGIVSIAFVIREGANIITRINNAGVVGANCNIIIPTKAYLNKIGIGYLANVKIGNKFMQLCGSIKLIECCIAIALAGSAVYAKGIIIA